MISSVFGALFVVSVTGFFAPNEGIVAATLPRSPRAMGLFAMFEAWLPLLFLRMESPDMLIESDPFLLELVSPAAVEVATGCSLSFLAPCSRSFCRSNACAEGAGGGDGGGDGERLMGCADSVLLAVAVVSPVAKLALYFGS